MTAQRPLAGHLAGYAISRCIGVGGMGAVYEARHTVLNRLVALKTLHDSNADNQVMLARFLREAEIAARVRHAHVVDVYDAGIDAGVPYLVMELLEGETLATQLAREGRLAMTDAVNLVLPLTAALAEVHRRGIVHWDIKAENVFVALDARRDVVVKLLDFGISKDLRMDSAHPLREATAAASPMPSSPMIEGTPESMAPEQLRGDARPDPRTDQYALGILLYHCLSGVRPFTGGSLTEVAYRVREGQCQSLERLCPHVPKALVCIVQRAMAVRLEDRFPTIEALGVELLRFATSEVRAAYERDLLRGWRASTPGTRRPWLPPLRRLGADVPDERLGRGSPPPVEPRRPRLARAFARSALIAAILLLGALLWFAWPTLRDASRQIFGA